MFLLLLLMELVRSIIVRCRVSPMRTSRNRSWPSGAAADAFPLGLIVTNGLPVGGAQQYGHRYIPMLLERIDRGEISTAHLVTHLMPLDEGPPAYDLFKNKKDGCVRAVFRPHN